MDEVKLITKSLKIKLIIVILISNIITALILIPSKDDNPCLEQKDWNAPQNYEQINVQGRLLTSFHIGKKISVFDSKSNYITDGFLVEKKKADELSMASENLSEQLLIAVPANSVQSFSPQKIYHLYPEITDFKKFTKENYEVNY